MLIKIVTLCLVFETMGANIASEEDFSQRFRDIDQDQDGFVQFADLERYLRLSSSNEASLSESSFARFVNRGQSANRQLILSPEALSAIT